MPVSLLHRFECYQQRTVPGHATCSALGLTGSDRVPGHHAGFALERFFPIGRCPGVYSLAESVLWSGDLAQLWSDRRPQTPESVTKIRGPRHARGGSPPRSLGDPVGRFRLGAGRCAFSADLAQMSQVSFAVMSLRPSRTA